MASQAILVGLADELVARAPAAASAITELILETRRSIAAAPDPAPGKRLLEALVNDARASLT